MRPEWCLPVFLCLAACSGVALNTTVANSPAARVAMAQSVIYGVTTERDLELRWGLPVQKLREGGKTAYIYRDLRNPGEWYRQVPNYGTSDDYVIVTFRYGLATAVVTSDEVDCRATFTPRPPNYTFDNPTQVEPRGTCYTEDVWPGRGNVVGDPVSDSAMPIEPDTYSPSTGNGATK